MASALASVIENYDLETDPEVLPVFRLLRDALNTKLREDPGHIIDLRKHNSQWNL